MIAAPDLKEAIDAFQSGDLDRARAIAKREIALAPSPQWQHLLGLIHCRQGRPEDGLEHLQAALFAEPANVQYRVMLVRALIDVGRGVEALHHARRPRPGPAAADLWRLRAEAADAAGSIADRNEALRNIELEAVTGQLEENPANLRLLLHRGRLLDALWRDQEAGEVYRSILAADPSNSEAVRELGLLLERTNRLDELRQLVDGAVSSGCDRNDFALLEALLAWREGDPGRALEWLSRVSPAEEPTRARQLEIKVQDSLGNSQAAFRAALAKNQAVPDRGRWRESARAFRRQLRLSAELVNSEWAARWSPVSPTAARPPAFLIGFPRSGTTLLDTFLMGHPEIHVLEEIPILGVVAEKLGSLEALAGLQETTAEQLRAAYLNALAASVPKDFVGLVVDKLPLNMLWVPLIYRLFPDAKLLFAQRHPCDCVLSAFLQSFSLNPSMANFLDLGDSADFYDVAMDLWSRSAQALPVDLHRVVYERLVEDARAELRPAIEFLGLEWSDTVIEHRRTARDRGAISTPSYDQVVQPITNSSVGRWRHYERQLEPVLPVLLGWAERLGYRD
jgi:tetratricopeptide (TPR) repeat protein